MAGTFRTNQEKIKKYSTEKFEDVVFALADATEDIIKQLAMIYAEYLDGVSPEEYYNEMIKYNRLNKAFEKMKETYTTAYNDDAARVERALRNMFIDSYYRHQYLYEYFSDVDLKFLLTNERLKSLTDYSLRGSPDLWKTLKNQVKHLEKYTPQIDSLKNLLKNDRDKAVLKIKKTLNNIFLTGESFQNAKKSLEVNLFRYDKKAYEMTKGEKKKYTSSIERIFRTEETRLYNLSGYASASNIENTDLLQKEWLSTVDVKTRDQHQTIDGQQTDIDGFFTFNGNKAFLPGQFGVASLDINCRCSTIYIVAGIQPEQRRGRNPVTGQNEIFSWGSYQDYLKKVS